jgi:hypothetical protein
MGGLLSNIHLPYLLLLTVLRRQTRLVVRAIYMSIFNMMYMAKTLILSFIIKNDLNKHSSLFRLS